MIQKIIDARAFLRGSVGFPSKKALASLIEEIRQALIFALVFQLVGGVVKLVGGLL